MIIIKLRTEVSAKKGDPLHREIKAYIQKKPMVPCKGLNRRLVFLTKYIDATHGRPDKTRRRQRFFAGVELLRRAKLEDMTDQIKEPTGEPAFEFKGITSNGEVVGVHVREEVEGKDKKLYLISTF